MKYYDKDGNMNEQAFMIRLEQLHNEIDETHFLDGLLKIRSKLYRLKGKYERCGRRFVECEYEIIALNEIISAERAPMWERRNHKP